MGSRTRLGEFNFNVDAGGEIELHQRVDRLRRRLHDIEQPLVGSHLELLARLLVDVRRTVDGEFLNSRRQWDWTADQGTRSPSRVGDVASSLVEHSVIEGLQANTDILRFHVPTDAKEPVPDRLNGKSGLKPKSSMSGSDLFGLTAALPVKLKSEPRDLVNQNRAASALYYFVISATTPAPTVRPPSRMAKRRPGSMAIGAISLTPRFTLSPGITISVPSGSSTSPVTSVVRK